MPRSPHSTMHLYPAPTLVVGVGRFGLAVLERMGEDWMWLSTSSGQDASRANLRLLHVRPGDDAARAWREPEQPMVVLTRYVGDDDLPTLALDFAILRSLGLVRYHNGAYQVALPRDAGIIEKSDRATGAHTQVLRRRYFEWHALGPDPLVATERLRAQSERLAELDMFLTPILERVRHGHSPRLLLRCIGRCTALLEGRDPSPWDWIAERLPAAGQQDAANPALPVDPTWLSDDDRAHLLEGFAPEPLAGWRDWAAGDFSGPGPAVHVPAPFVPAEGDLRAPLDPLNLLKIDWETNGWATDEVLSDQAVEFHPVAASMLRLGFFDHDPTSRIHANPAASDALSGRLRALGQQVHRGLVRLWIDMQRSRVEDLDLQQDERTRHGTDEAMRQSVNLLGELLVRPVLDADLQPGPDPEAPGHAMTGPAMTGPAMTGPAITGPAMTGPVTTADGPLATEPRRRDTRVDGDALPARATSFLRGLVLEQDQAKASTERALNARLARLGLPYDPAGVGAHALFREIELGPDALRPATTLATPRLTALRAAVNDEVRHLFDFALLSQYRQRPTRQAPRLTVYVVGEMSEPFTRRAMRAVLREVHEELLRAYGPIFGSSREGFDRPLSLVPIVWMPHPSDAFGGEWTTENRAEEAAILEAVQQLRRWVETVPRESRCISQVFINSRVTANAVLSLRDAVRQTRDFVSFGARNDISRDPWLRETAVGPPGDDVFATFACFEIDFPAERAREYLANRFARDAIARLRQTNRGEPPEVSGEPFRPPAIGELIESSERDLRGQTGSAADRLAARIEDRITVTSERTARELERAFDPDFEDELFARVHESWSALTRRRGNMDEMIDALRRRTSGLLATTLQRVRHQGDALIEEHASQGGLESAMLGFDRVQGDTRDQLLAAEAEKLDGEALCVRHRIPDPQPIAAARAAVVDAARTKPDALPMKLGLAAWLVMAPALGAPLMYALALALGLHRRPGVLEFLLGPLGPVLGAALVFLPAAWLLRRHMNEAVDRVHRAVRALADAARSVVEGPDGSVFAASPSIRSFFAARLRLTAALATRNYATRVHQQVVEDSNLAHRLGRSIEIQQNVLMRRAEDLGVRPRVALDTAAGDGERIHDDLRHLFATRSGEEVERLIGPEFLATYYRRHIANDHDLDNVLPRFIKTVGGFTHWRREACLADTDAILGYGRAKFDAIVATPVCEQVTFDDEVGARLAHFVARHYPNVGFGARFAGFEGLDTNGIRVLADATLVVHPTLVPVYDKARRRPDTPPTTETLDVQAVPVLPNSAYMLSLVQGIRAESIRNLQPFEGHFDRLALPDDAGLGLTDTALVTRASGAITHLTGHEDLGSRIHATLRYDTRNDARRGDPRPDDTRPDDTRPDDTAGGRHE